MVHFSYREAIKMQKLVSTSLLMKGNKVLVIQRSQRVVPHQAKTYQKTVISLLCYAFIS